MNSDEIAAQIRLLEANLESKRSRMDGMVVSSRSAIATAAASWMNHELKRRIEENPTVVTALGIERLRELKADVARTVAKLPEVIVLETSAPEVWQHRKPKAPGDDGYSHIHEETIFALTFRAAISTLGAVLERYGLLASDKGQYSSWKNLGAGKFRYGINPGIDANSLGLAAEYGALMKEVRSERDNISRQQVEFEKAKARELFESA